MKRLNLIVKVEARRIALREIEKRYSIINQLYEGNPQLIAQKFSEDILLMLNQEVTALANAEANP